MFKGIAKLIAMAGLLAPQAAFADGIEISRIVRPNMSGNYTMRVVLVTDNAVNNLQYGLYNVTKDGRIGDQYADVTFRPAILNTQAGRKENLLVSFSGTLAPTEQLMALCMWKEPPTAIAGSGSQLLSAFRYCKLFTAKP